MLDAISSMTQFGVSPPVAAQKLTPADSLTASITMEGLLFAAFAVGSKLTEWVDGGRHTFFALGRFGWTIVGVIYFVAAAAAVSWVEVFGVGWPASPGEFLLGLGLSIGILAQPVFATVINYQLSREDGSE